MAKKHLLGPFDWFLLVGIVACNVINSIMSNSFDILGTVVSIAGIVNVVLCANGSIVNYPFGLIYVTLYAYICFKSQPPLLFAAALNGLYYTPMQFVGFFQWRKRMQSGNSTLVIPRTMETKGKIITTVISVVAILFSVCLLYFVKIGNSQPLKDVNDVMLVIPRILEIAGIALCVIAMVLMAKAYLEQWPLWNISNVFFLAMWVAKFINGEPHSGPMVITWVFFLINSIRGWIEWKKMVDKQEAEAAAEGAAEAAE